MPRARGRKRTGKCPACGEARRACPRDSDYECHVEQSIKRSRLKYVAQAPRIKYVIPKLYTPDFHLLTSDIIVEAKGWFPPSDRQKMEAIIRSNPERDIRILLQRPSDKIRKDSKTTLAQWCERRGITWAQGPELPKEWR